MNYKIVVDSCCELPEKWQNDPRFESVPLQLEVGDYHIIDDKTFNQKEFLQKVAESSACPKSACPSPEQYMEAYNTEADHIYVVTLSSKLSGSYNSAELGKKLYIENHGEKKIHVIDSLTASCGESQIAYKLVELEEQGLSFEEICTQIDKFRDEMNTYFILGNIDTMYKNGRMSRVKAVLVSTLNIRLILGDDEGTFVLRGQALGMKKAMAKMVDLIVSEIKNAGEKRIMISHCNALERGMIVKEALEKRVSCKEITLQDTAGVSSMYCADGGVIVTV